MGLLRKHSGWAAYTPSPRTGVGPTLSSVRRPSHHLRRRRYSGDLAIRSVCASAEWCPRGPSRSGRFNQPITEHPKLMKIDRRMWHLQRMHAGFRARFSKTLNGLAPAAWSSGSAV